MPAMHGDRFPRVVSRPGALVAALFIAVPLAIAAGAVAQGPDIPAPLYALSGHVNTTEGKPLEGASVSMEDASGANDAVPTTLTDADGFYEFKNVSPGDYIVTAWHDCCQSLGQDVSVGGSELSTTLDFALSSGGGTGSAILSGRVHDVATDAGVGGAVVQISNQFACETNASSGEGGGDGVARPEPYPYPEPCGYESFTVTSERDGSYETKVHQGSVYIWVDASGYDYTSGSVEVSGDMKLDIPVRSSEGQTVRITGTVVSTAGDPVQGAWVSVSPDHSQCERDGRLCPQPLPAMESGSSSDGRWYFEPRNYGYDSKQVEADGTFVLHTIPGRVIVSAYAEKFAPDDERLDVSDGQDEEVELVLEPIPPSTVRVHGCVVDASNGDPIEYAQVSLENQRWGDYNWTQTGTDGCYESFTKPGYSIVTISAYRFYWIPCEGEGDVVYARGETTTAEASDEKMASPMIMPACDGDQERDHDYLPRVTTFVAEPNSSVESSAKLLRMPPPDATFLGWVVDEQTDKGVPGVQVSFYNEITHDWGQATTGDDGSYRIEVRAGYYTVRTYAQEGYFDAALNTEIGSGEEKQLDVFVTPGDKAYGGYCCYAYAGKGGVAMAEDRAVASESMGAPSAAPTDPRNAAGAEQAEGDATATGSTGDGTADGYTASFSGGEGKLGAYSPGKTVATDGGAGAPGVGVFAVLSVLAGFALVAGRRRR